MNARIHPERSLTPESRTEDDFSLPGWIYSDPEFFELERKSIFSKCWHLVCHVNDVPEAGDFQTLNVINESILTVRGKDGQVRSFHNVCRHRASRLVDSESGNCGHMITCPYHAWSYATDGRLVGVPMRANYPGMDPKQYGLAPIEQEIWRGFVFVRFAPGLPSVQDQFAPYADEIASAPLEDIKPLGPARMQTRSVNWKNVSDNYSDGLHIPVSHPGLTRIFGKSYMVEAKEWVDKMSGELVDHPSPHVSERMYQSLIRGHGAERRPCAALELLQALAERRYRVVSGPDRFHAVRAGVADRDVSCATSTMRCRTAGARCARRATSTGASTGS